MKRPLLALLIGLASAAANSCSDPGCIRNSECDEGYFCSDSTCIPIPAKTGDGGTAGTSSTDASTPDAAISSDDSGTK